MRSRHGVRTRNSLPWGLVISSGFLSDNGCLSRRAFLFWLKFMRKKNVRLPAWLDLMLIPANPWTSRAEFRKNANSPQMKELRQFLLDTVAEQTQFMVARAQGAMEKILKTTPDGTEREHIVVQFTRVIRASENFYPLIDYINFKGEGTNPNELP